MQHAIPDDLDVLLAVLPARVREAILKMEARTELLEIVLDLGRAPERRFPTREGILGDYPVTRVELDSVAERIGQFAGDNRAGVGRTLHGISAMRNRRGERVRLRFRAG